MTSVKMCQDYREKPLGTYFDVFSSFLGFILPQTDQKCTFYTFLVQNGQVAVTKQVQIGFSRPGPF